MQKKIHTEKALLKDPKKIVSAAVQFHRERHFYSSRKESAEFKGFRFLQVWIMHILSFLPHCYSVGSSFTPILDPKITQAQKKLPNVYLDEEVSLVELEAESRHTDSQPS